MPHFRLTSVAEKRLCLNSLVPGRPQVFLLRNGEGRCHNDMGIPIPKTLVILASPSRLQGMHMSVGFWEWGCPYYCDSTKGKDLGNGLVCAKEGRKDKTASPFTSSFHCPLRFFTYHSHFALTSMRNKKSLRRRQASDNYD